MRLLLLLFSLFLASCSCEWHGERIQKKCGSSSVKDTIILRDTIRIPSVQTDTIFKPGRDTVIIREGRLTMKYFYNSSDSTVYLSGKCDTVFITRDIKVPYEKIVIVDNWFVRNKWWILICSVLALGGFAVIRYFFPPK